MWLLTTFQAQDCKVSKLGSMEDGDRGALDQWMNG